MEDCLLWELGEEFGELLWGDDAGVSEEFELLDICQRTGPGRHKRVRITVRMVRSERFVIAAFCSSTGGIVGVNP